MARDEGLEELLREDLEGERGLGEKRMFGGLTWLLYGNLLCAASDRGLLIRMGKGNDWALELPDVEPMIMHGRRMEGWLRAGPDAYGDDSVRRRLLNAALEFVRTLPVKL